MSPSNLKPEEEAPAGGQKPSHGRRVLVVVGLAAVVGVGVWLATGRHDGTESSMGFAMDSHANARVVSDDDLPEITSQLNHTVFWAGERSDTQIEMRHDTSGNVHLRYLTDGAEAGTDKASYLDVGTYPFAGAFNATRSLAHGDGVTKVRVGRAVGFYPEDRPYSVFLSYPGRPNLQIEVYHPEENEALAIVEDGDIVPMN